MRLRRILSAVFVPLFIFMAVVFPMEKSYATESLNLLPSDINLNDKVGKQPSYNENDPYSWACASYCVAYAKAIIDGQKHDPKEYWSTPTSGSVVWGKGKYSHPNNNKYNNSSDLLKDVYKELKAGRLPIIYVTLYYSSGASYSEHWALVVGYQNVNVDNLDSLTEKNFIAIDSNQPWYLKTLGETYPRGQSSLKLGSVLKAAYSSETVHKHSYTGPYRSDTEHWWQCSCGAKAKIATHTFGEWTVTKEASTTEPGSKTRSCSFCGFEETLEIPVLIHTHSYGTDWKNNATSHWHECTCGDKTDVAEHSFGEWTVTKEASTTEPGSKTRSCSVCGFEETLEIPVLSHTHSYGTDWKNNETSHWHECTCGDKTDMAAHSFRWVIDRAATATQKGSKHEECTVCGYRRAAVEIPATGTTTGGNTGGGHSHYHPTTTPVPVIVIPPKTGDMTIWQGILHFLGIR